MFGMGVAQFPQPGRDEGWGDQPRTPRGRAGRGCTGRRKRRRRQAPAGSWASCQHPPCSPAGEASAAALTQPAARSQISNVAGQPWSCCFSRLGVPPVAPSLPGSGGAAAACSTGTGRGLTVDQKGLKTGGRIRRGAKLLCLAAQGRRVCTTRPGADPAQRWREGKGWIEQGSCLTSSYWVWDSCFSALETLGVGLRGS